MLQRQSPKSDPSQRRPECRPEDGRGIKDRDAIGVDNLMWGSDYPHTESTFPKSRQILDEILAGIPDDEKAKIAGGNAARLYNFN